MKPFIIAIIVMFAISFGAAEFLKTSGYINKSIFGLCIYWSFENPPSKHNLFLYLISIIGYKMNRKTICMLYYIYAILAFMFVILHNVGYLSKLEAFTDNQKEQVYSNSGDLNEINEAKCLKPDIEKLNKKLDNLNGRMLAIKEKQNLDGE